jgi:hypothetical protein
MDNPSWVSKGDTDINKQLKEKSCIANLKGNSEEFHDSLYLHRTQLLLTMDFYRA